MKRTLKNTLLFTCMALALCMTVLTVLHASGSAAAKLPDTDRNFLSRDPMQGMNAGMNAGADAGSEIGEITLPDGAEPIEAAPEEPAGAGQRPVDGMLTDFMRGKGELTAGGMPAGGTVTDLAGHLAFAVAWIFLFAFCLAWAIFSRLNATSGKSPAKQN